MRRNFLIPVFLAALTLAVFLPATSHDFVLWDDDRNIYENPLVTSGDSSAFSTFWRAPYIGLYIPVTYSTWTLLAQASPPSHTGAPLNPFLFHAANVLFHVASSVLVFFLISRLLPRKDILAAALGAAIFAVHPLQVEPVAWATGLKDVLSTFLGLLAIFFYLHRPHHSERSAAPPPPSPLLYVASLASFSLALLAKPSLVPLPLLLLLLDVGLVKSPLRRSALLVTPHFALSFAAIALTMSIQHQPVLAIPPADIPLLQRPIVALDSIAFYISKFAFPTHLVSDYGRTPLAALDFNGRYPVWLCSALLAFLVFRLKENRRFFAVALAFFLFALAPVCGLITFAHQGISTVADRYMYLPIVGIALAAAGWLSLSPARWPRAAVALALTAFSVISALQLRHWRNSESFLTQILTANPKSVVAHYNLGLLNARNGNTSKAARHYEQAILSNPDFYYPYNNLGRLLNKSGEFHRAAALLQKGVTLAPNDPQLRCNLAHSLANLNRFTDAALHQRYALTLSPHDPRIMVDLAYILANKGDFAESIDWFRKAVALKPELPTAYSGLGMVYLKLNRPQDASHTLEQLIGIEAADPWAHKLLADAYASSGKPEKARTSAAHALSLAKSIPNYPPHRLQQIEHGLRQFSASPDHD